MRVFGHVCLPFASLGHSQRRCVRTDRSRLTVAELPMRDCSVPRMRYTSYSCRAVHTECREDILHFLKKSLRYDFVVHPKSLKCVSLSHLYLLYFSRTALTSRERTVNWVRGPFLLRERSLSVWCGSRCSDRRHFFKRVYHSKFNLTMRALL